MNANAKRTLGGLAAAALILPAAAIAKPGNGQGHGNGQDKAGHELRGHGHGKARAVPYLFGGTVASVDAGASTIVVDVTRGNHWARQFRGDSVTFDVSGVKRIHVRDNDGNGARELADVQAGDRVIVKARLPKQSAGDQPFAANGLIDVARANAPAPDDSAGSAG